MSPLIIFSVCALLPVVFSADVEKIQKAIEVYEQNTGDHKLASAEIQKSIDNLSAVYKKIISNLTVAKGEVNDASQEVMTKYKTAVHTLKELKATEAREKEEVQLHKAILRKLNLAQKWLTQDLNVLEHRKKDGDDQECQAIEEQQKAKQSSRSLAEDDEEKILKEELSLAEIAAYDAAEEQKNLQFKLDKEQELWKQEVESTFKVINKYKSKLIDLTAKLESKNAEIQEVEKSIAALLKEKAELQVSIREAGIKFKKDVKLLKSFHAAAECYLALRNSVVKAH